MKRQLLPAVLALGTALCLPNAAWADNQYQFSLDTFLSKLNVSGNFNGDEPHGEINAIGATVYLEPVQLNGKYHQKVAAFYQRASGLSVGGSEGEYQELTIIRGGRVLESMEFGSKQVSLFGSIPNTPVWLNGDFVEFDETEYKFSSGSPATGKAEDYKALSAGFFLQPDHSVYARYSDAYMDGFGGGFRSYFHLGQGMGLEFGGEIERIKTDEDLSTVEVEDNTLRNAVIEIGQVTRSWQSHLAFLPHRDVSISVAYGKTEDSDEIKQEIMGSELKYFVTPNVNVGIGHRENNLNRLGERMGYINYEQYFATLGVRF